MPARPSPSSVPEPDHELIASIALSLLPPGCRIAIVEALRRAEPPSRVFRRTLAERWPHEPAAADAFTAKARAAQARAAAASLTAIAWSDARYPAPLAAIVDPPPVLWTRGDPAAFAAPLVAIVGSRAASPYARDVAASLAADLVARGVVVVSGLARGVDSAAHRGALDAGGLTVAVLGSGVDVVYPPEHDALVEAITQHGVVASELVPGTPPMPYFFPMRNRIISGLSRAVVVVEAHERSGSLITARCALEQGRDVLAVPGNVLSGRNRGAHALLKDGAKIVESADDILEELGMGVAGSGYRVQGSPGSQGSRDPILDCLVPGEPSDLDEIAERTGLVPSRLLPRLLELELAGTIARAGGGRFVRTDRPC
jgi:DNA processing protein